MKNLWGREPALVVALVGSVIALAISFGLDLSTDQVGAIMAVTSAILGLIVRSQVSPATKEEVPTPEPGPPTIPDPPDPEPPEPA